MCDPPAIIEWTNVRILRPGRAPPIRPTRRTVAFTRASNPSRWVSVATSNNPALATRFESSKVTSIRSIACDTRLTGSASWLPDNEGFRHPHRPSPGGLSRGYATRHTHDRSVHRGLDLTPPPYVHQRRARCCRKRPASADWPTTGERDSDRRLPSTDVASDHGEGRRAS